MNVVIVDGDISYPPTSGKRLRTLHLMLPLARRHRITYIARGDAHSAEARAAETFLAEHGITPVFVDHPVARKAGPRFYARLAANLLSPLPYSVTSLASPRVRQALLDHARRHPVDVWHIEWLAYLSALEGLGPARTVLSTHNVETLIWQRYHEVERHPLQRWYIGRQYRKWERYEREVFARATRVVAVSHEDAALMRERFGVPEVDVVENGIDGTFFAEVQPRREPGHVLFIGSLEFRPNLDAVRLLLDEVFPAVRAREPAARLSVVGRNPPPWLVDLARREAAVELHANVPDVRPFLARAAVLAVPLRVGGGSRLKILEALACGLPVVSTRVGAEGLCLTPGEEIEVVEQVGEMTDVLVRCLRDPAPALARAEKGRQVVRERYDWGPLADKMERVWEACLRAGAPRRRVGNAHPAPEVGVAHPTGRIA
jgi:glycosyltransferase involved in cell wall biosynthesis